MTNKPMLSVERDLLLDICDDFEAGRHFKACEGAAKLRAILNKHSKLFEVTPNKVFDNSSRTSIPFPKINPPKKPDGATHFEKSDKCQSTGGIQYYRHDGGHHWSYWPEGLNHWSSLACKPSGDIEPIICTHPAGCTSCSWCGFKAEQHHFEPVGWAHEDGLTGISAASKTSWPSSIRVFSHRSDLDGVSIPLFRQQPAPVAVPLNSLAPFRTIIEKACEEFNYCCARSDDAGEAIAAHQGLRAMLDAWPSDNPVPAPVAVVMPERDIASELVEMMNAPSYFDNMSGVDHSKWFKWDWSERKARPISKYHLCDVVLSDGRVLFDQSPHDFDWTGDDVAAARQGCSRETARLNGVKP